MPDLPRQSDAALPDRIRLPFAFDPAQLAADLARVTADGWIDHLVKRNYEGDWTVLPLRIPAGATHPVMMIYADPTATQFEDAPALARTPYFRHVLERFACPLQTVRLMRLAPGSRIREHRDHDLAAEYGAARIHVPVTTGPEVDFLLNGRRVAMTPGSAWYLRLSDPHSVANRGAADRVHLVIDCVVDDWLATLLHDAAQTKQPISTISESTG